MKHPLHASGYRPPFDSPLHRLDARAKLLAALAYVLVIVSTPAHAWPAFAAYAALLAVGLLAGRVPPGYLLARWLIVLPFLAASAALPFLGPTDLQAGPFALRRAGLLVLANVAMKASLAVTVMTLLIASTHLSDILRALGRLGTPRVLVMLVALTHRYLALLLDEARRMRRARDARGFGGRWIWQAAVVGRMVGTLFLRSFQRAERVHAAMLARGFDGTTLLAAHDSDFRPADWLVLSLWLAALAGARIWAL